MQGKWWQITLIVLFFLGFFVCAIDWGQSVPARSVASLASDSPREPDLGDAVRVATQDAKSFFLDMGNLLLELAIGFGQRSTAILGYLGCVILLLVPFGIWALMNLGRILRASQLSINVGSGQAND